MGLTAGIGLPGAPRALAGVVSRALCARGVAPVARLPCLFPAAAEQAVVGVWAGVGGDM